MNFSGSKVICMNCSLKLSLKGDKIRLPMNPSIFLLDILNTIDTLPVFTIRNDTLFNVLHPFLLEFCIMAYADRNAID